VIVMVHTLGSECVVLVSNSIVYAGHRRDIFPFGKSEFVENIAEGSSRGASWTRWHGVRDSSRKQRKKSVSQIGTPTCRDFQFNGSNILQDVGATRRHQAYLQMSHHWPRHEHIRCPSESDPHVVQHQRGVQRLRRQHATSDSEDPAKGGGDRER
jgi:hypothetical protein